MPIEIIEIKDELGQLLYTRSLDEIYRTLVPHRVNSVGLVPIERWRAILARAGRRGAFVSVDEQALSRDAAVYLRYSTDLRNAIPARYPMPDCLTLRQLDRFLESSGGGPPPARFGQQA